MTSWWQHFLAILGSLGGAIAVALVGVFTRITHEHVQNVNQFTWNRVLFSLPSAILMGIIGGSVGSYLQTAYGFPESIAWALAGALGYLGPAFINTSAQAAIGYFRREKPEDADKNNGATPHGRKHKPGKGH